MAIALLPMFAAYEAHVVNVTAKIENALSVPLKEMKFGTVFPQEKLDQTFDVSLSGSFLEQSQGTQNLICNGSFEIPEVTNAAKWQIFPNGYEGLCWSVAWEPGAPTYGGLPRPEPALAEYHELVNPTWLAQEGNQYAELDADWYGPSSPQSGEPALVNIYQNIPTTPGQTYVLSYYFSPRPNTGASENEMSVRVNGTEIRHLGPTAGGSGTLWTLYVDVFQAASASTKVEFAGAGTNDSLGVFLDNVQMKGTGRVDTVSYIIRQKPKCGLPVRDQAGAIIEPVSYDDFGLVTEDANGAFKCADEGYVMLPLLCPYLSKHEMSADGDNTENDGPGIKAFHGLPGAWDLAKAMSFDSKVWGVLTSSGGDTADLWNIDLKVPCFRGFCAQDWPTFVATFSEDGANADPEAYKADPALQHAVFGCDLWLEVTNIRNRLQPPV